MRAVLAALLLCGCTIPDGIGNHMPMDCSDVSSVTDPVQFVTDGEMLDLQRRLLPAANGFPVWGINIPKRGKIYVLDSLPPETKAQVVHHEKCHVLIVRLTGKPWLHHEAWD